MNPIKILILTANPKIPNYEPLRLDAEVREIEEALRRSVHRDRFQLETQLATRTRDLRRALLDHQPQIVHFSGHGSGEDGLVLENDAGTLQLVSTEALEHLFAASEYSEVECVLLNACHSEIQAIAIHQVVDCVIGMNQPIGDKAAVQFAIGFYDALGAGRSYEEAYNYGRSAISAAGIAEYEIPVLKYRKRRDVSLLGEQSEPRSQSAQENVRGAIAPPTRPSQSQSLGDITISGSNNPFSNIQSGGNVTLSQTSSQSGSTDLQTALEALVKLEQDVSALHNRNMKQGETSCSVPIVARLRSVRMVSKEVNKITFAKLASDNLLNTMIPQQATPMKSNENASKCMSMAWDFEALSGSKAFITPPSLLGLNRSVNCCPMRISRRLFQRWESWMS